MASSRFYLEKRRDENVRTRTKQVPILLYFSFCGKRLQLNTGERIDFSDWDFRAQPMLLQARGSKAMNRYLQSLADEVMEIYLEAKTVGLSPGIDYLRKQIKYSHSNNTISKNLDVLKWCLNCATRSEFNKSPSYK
jgi:hypothetical protein